MTRRPSPQTPGRAFLAIALVVAAVLGPAIPSPARADGAIVALMSDADFALLADIDARRAAALAAVATSPDIAGRAALDAALAGVPLEVVAGFDPASDWRCRRFRIGPGDGLAITDWSACQVFDDGAGWVLDTPDGLHRSRGRLYDLAPTRLLYLGARHAADAPPVAFGDDPDRNELAVLTRLDDGRIRLEFPAPLDGSAFDILELRR